jgi:hypothetical protein
LIFINCKQLSSHGLDIDLFLLVSLVGDSLPRLTVFGFGP